MLLDNLRKYATDLSFLTRDIRDGLDRDRLFYNDLSAIKTFLNNYIYIIQTISFIFSFFLFFGTTALILSYISISEKEESKRITILKSFERYFSKLCLTLSLIFIGVFLILLMNRRNYFKLIYIKFFLFFYFMYIFSVLMFRNYLRTLNTTNIQIDNILYYVFFSIISISLIGLLICFSNIRIPLLDLKVCKLNSRPLKITYIIAITISLLITLEFLFRDIFWFL